jgi:hypothetical protein
MLAVWVLHQFFDGAGDASIPQPDTPSLDFRRRTYQVRTLPCPAPALYYLGADATPAREILESPVGLRVLVYDILPAPLRAAAHYYRGDDAGASNAAAETAETALFRPLWRSGTRRR